ncbi:Leo1-like protein-domain-containing protein [Xylariaceae sp. FL0804]|nr:Leo1-like protein-domain-containing protein [Xylariaceae sp. FL0804]
MSDSDEPIELPEEGGDDLFGDEDNAPQSDQERVLSDKDLASDQDEDERSVQEDDEDTQPQVIKEKRIQEIDLYRHRLPKTKNGMLQIMKVPSFLKWLPVEYNPDTFEPTEWDIRNAQSDNPKGVVRCQKDPQTGEVKSNTVVYRWSDGSMTMAVGGEHYEMQRKMMAPSLDKPYEEREDAHYYATAAHMKSNCLMTVGRISERYTVSLNRNMQDEARIKFANDMAAATRGKRPQGGDMIITARRDPELQKKEAELAEKERLKAQRRIDNAQSRLDVRTGGYRSGGLSVGELEGGRRGAGGARKRGAPGASRAKRRRPEYDSDDDLPSGTRRQDEYDVEDDFIAPSDDDAMSDIEDDEEEDLLDDDEEEEAPRKRRKTAESEDADADADADLDDIEMSAPAESSRVRRRNVIDDDEDE